MFDVFKENVLSLLLTVWCWEAIMSTVAAIRMAMECSGSQKR